MYLIFYTVALVSTAKRLHVKTVFLHPKSSFKIRIVKEETELLLVNPGKYQPPAVGLVEKLVPKC